MWVADDTWVAGGIHNAGENTNKGTHTVITSDFCRGVLKLFSWESRDEMSGHEYAAAAPSAGDQPRQYATDPGSRSTGTCAEHLPAPPRLTAAGCRREEAIR